MKKALIFGLLMLLVGFFLWRLVAVELFNPAEKLTVGVDKENFAWFECSNCGNPFMAEATTRRGYCPYCNFQMMLVTEDKRVMGKSVDGDDFAWFFSHECGNVFYARETKKTGTCPYCAESVNLTAPRTTIAKGSVEAPSRLAAWTKDNYGILLMGTLVLFTISAACVCFLIESRTILSLRPVEGIVSQDSKIELSKWQTRKKRLTLGNAQGDDIILTEPSLKGDQYILSFVRVGGKTRAYLSRDSDQPVLINEEKEYNPRLHNRDRIRLGDVVFEVSTRDR